MTLTSSFQIGRLCCSLLLVSALTVACGGGDSASESASKASSTNMPSEGEVIGAASAANAAQALASASATQAAPSLEELGQQATGREAKSDYISGSPRPVASSTAMTTQAATRKTTTITGAPGTAGGAVSTNPTTSDGEPFAQPNNPSVPFVDLAAGPTAKIAAASGEGVASSSPPVNCVLEQAIAFGGSSGTACYAVAKGTITDGSSKTFPNTRAGYSGNITAVCKAGSTSWSQEVCKSIAVLRASPETASPPAAESGVMRGTQDVTSANDSTAYKIGTYYFQGWKADQVGSAYSKPWENLKLYVDREPMLGQYAEDAPGVMTQQLKWMRQYGIDFSVFNWYWASHSAPVLDHALRAYLALPNREGVKFAVQWSNHTNYNFSRTQFEALFRFWARNYFKHTDYQRFNGKPVVFIFSAPVLLRNAKAIGMSTAELIKMADDIALAEGLPGVSVIGGMWGGDSSFDYASTGYAAFTMYNYHSPANIALQPHRAGNYSRSYAELHQSYENQWKWMLQRTALPFIVPMSSGWDRRPWGGSKDPLHDDSRSTPAEFLVHLKAARTLMDANPSRTQRMGVVCCWNELGEGSFIEPTKFDGFGYIEQIPKVFGSR